MAYETGAPPPPEHTPIEIVEPEHEDPLRPALRPAAGYEATAVISGLGGPTPGTTTYRLRATETTETSD